MLIPAANNEISRYRSKWQQGGDHSNFWSCHRDRPPLSPRPTPAVTATDPRCHRDRPRCHRDQPPLSPRTALLSPRAAPAVTLTGSAVTATSPRCYRDQPPLLPLTSPRCHLDRQGEISCRELQDFSLSLEM